MNSQSLVWKSKFFFTQFHAPRTMNAFLCRSTEKKTDEKKSFQICHSETPKKVNFPHTKNLLNAFFFFRS